MASSTTPPTSKVKPARPKAAAPRRKQRAKPPTGSLFKQALEVSPSDAAKLLRLLCRLRRWGETAGEQGRAEAAPPAQPIVVQASGLPADNAPGLRAHRGREAVLVGACAALRRDDCVLSTACECAAFLARGGTLQAAFARTGSAIAAGAVRGGPAVAVGAGLACKLNKQGQVALCFLDAAAAGAGAFHEALQLAVLWHVPVVFVCANDQPPPGTCSLLSVSPERRRGAPKPAPLHVRAGGYGLESLSCDGTHVLEVRATVVAACEHARNGKGPVFIEALTPRAPDGAAHEEMEQWRAKDPVAQFRVVLEEAEAISAAQADAIEEEVAAEVEAAAKAAAGTARPARGGTVSPGDVAQV